MSKKPTYEELENRIQELEQKESEHNLVEESFRENEEILRVFVKNTPAAVAMCDLQMRYVAYSDRWVHDYGLSNDDLIGTCHYDAFPDLPSHWRKEHKRCFLGDVIINEKEPFLRADGSIDWVRRNLQPWRQKSGQIGGLIMFTEVVSERVESERKLKESLAELSVLGKRESQVNKILKKVALRGDTLEDVLTMIILVHNAHKINLRHEYQ